MTKLKIAIQKSGRLNKDSLALLNDCGISIDNGKDQLKASARNFPVEVLYLRNGDIPQYLRDGVVDVAILGENTLVEKGQDLEIIERLGFSKCRVSLAVPKEVDFKGIGDFEGKRIATSYPNTVNKFLDENGINAEIHIINGSVEIAPNIGLADAVCDIVSSGSTLFKNGLKEVVKMTTSEAVLTAAPTLSKEKQEILDTIQFRIQAVLRGQNSKYILLNAPNDKVTEISEILSGMRSPTVLPLAKEGWSSIHAVVFGKGKFWDMIDDLKKRGAEGILVVPIEKMVL